MGFGLEGDATSRLAELAKGQRFLTQRSSTSDAIVKSLLQVSFQNTHRDWQHLDSFNWLEIQIYQLSCDFYQSAFFLNTFKGAISFIAIAVYFLTRPSDEIKFQEKVIFGTFFIGAIICLFCSALFHTLYCYSPNVCKLFNK